MRPWCATLMSGAAPQPTGLARASGTIVVGYLISSGSGLVTFGLKGLAADLAAVGAMPGAFMGVREVFQQRKSRGWVTVRNKIIRLDSYVTCAAEFG